MSAALDLENISFSYGNNNANIIEDFSLSVEPGSFTTLLGSSGSGKTTLLRLIAGFLEPTSGCIKINGEKVNGINPEKRKIGMVFQDYALFPHMSVQQNLLYGLKIKNQKSDGEKKSKQELMEKTLEISRMLDLENLLQRYPSELSGGQQQRVALGRALVLEPGILLMDEPLSSLDTKLRYTVRNELKEIQQRLKITTIYVTHDQEEALSLSDKIAVLNEGKLLQYGTSRQVYFKPADCFTADFIGSTNFITENDSTYMVRPEWIQFTSEDAADLTGEITLVEFLGNKSRYKVNTQKGIIIVENNLTVVEEKSVGEKVGLRFNYRRKMN